MHLTAIQIAFLSILKERSIRGTAQVGFALWPDRNMKAQGAALAAGKVLHGLIAAGYVSSKDDYKLSRYEITEAGKIALSLAQQEQKKQQPLNLI